MKGVDLLVIQPTPFCNINCSYCYLPNRSDTHRIQTSTVQRLIDALLEDHLLGNRLSIVWHAGEPLVLPPSFYQPLFDLFAAALEPLDVSIQHHIQTNATLITPGWCQLIKDYSISIGVSVDGPGHINDANRKTRSGKGVFDKIMEGISLLRSNGIPYHGIAVVTAASIEEPDALFNFFYENGFYNLGLNIEEIEGAHTDSTVFNDALYEKALQFYSRMFDLYMNSDHHMKLREFDRCLEAILREPGIPDIRRLSTDSHQNIPMKIISIDYKGNFSSFSPELIGQKAPGYNDFILGNIHTSSLAAPGYKDVLDKMTTEINKGIKKCQKECSFFQVCGGGAPANKYFENGSFNSSDTRYCNFNIKIPTELAVSYLEKQLLLK